LRASGDDHDGRGRRGRQATSGRAGGVGRRHLHGWPLDPSGCGAWCAHSHTHTKREKDTPLRPRANAHAHTHTKLNTFFALAPNTVRKNARSRDSVAREIYTSEKSYIETLEELVAVRRLLSYYRFLFLPLPSSCRLIFCTLQLYLKPLRKAIDAGSPIISARSIGVIFSNIEEIINIGHVCTTFPRTIISPLSGSHLQRRLKTAPLAQELIKMLEDRLSSWKERQCIADVFVCLGPYLEKYSTYVVSVLFPLPFPINLQPRLRAADKGLVAEITQRH